MEKRKRPKAEKFYKKEVKKAGTPVVLVSDEMEEYYLQHWILGAKGGERNGKKWKYSKKDRKRRVLTY